MSFMRAPEVGERFSILGDLGKGFLGRETIGSLMNQHCGKKRRLKSTNFSNEMMLRINLGPLNIINSLVDEVLKREPVSLVRNETRVNRLSSKDVCMFPHFEKKKMKNLGLEFWS